ncbi:hypothetical protein Fmac_004668 [Flemingia macrophylla]|uniref:Uncharacterized protein n=1 Tax=Flemingia macrophylla TaxID=520843 RepID=A0ABD1N703_9FABA
MNVVAQGHGPPPTLCSTCVMNVVVQGHGQQGRRRARAAVEDCGAHELRRRTVEVKLLAKKEDRFALDSAIDELIHLGMQSVRESEIERNKMKAEEAEAENEGLRKEL